MRSLSPDHGCAKSICENMKILYENMKICMTENYKLVVSYRSSKRLDRMNRDSRRDIIFVVSGVREVMIDWLIGILESSSTHVICLIWKHHLHPLRPSSDPCLVLRWLSASMHFQYKSRIHTCIGLRCDICVAMTSLKVCNWLSWIGVLWLNWVCIELVMMVKVLNWFWVGVELICYWIGFEFVQFVIGFVL